MNFEKRDPKKYFSRSGFIEEGTLSILNSQEDHIVFAIGLVQYDIILESFDIRKKTRYQMGQDEICDNLRRSEAKKSAEETSQMIKNWSPYSSLSETTPEENKENQELRENLKKKYRDLKVDMQFFQKREPLTQNDLKIISEYKLEMKVLEDVCLKSLKIHPENL